MSEPTNVLCNLCGLTCVLDGGVDHRELGGLIKAAVCGGYESTPGNGHGTLDDMERYKFSLCEFCVDWLFGQFKIPVDVDSYMDDFLLLDGESVDEGMKRTGGIVKSLPDPMPPPWEPAAVRVARDDWRQMKSEFTAEANRRTLARACK